ncbi:ASCH domain-containing protein [Candidatus Collierbacteria bacterium]|nr:ASCH domain-containing protein [Candidatus Collierbacteria bacterium]
MKILKFKGFKADWILEGTKTSTLRLFDDKDLRVGDKLDLINSDTVTVFAHAIITEVIQKTLGEINDIDLEGHEKWHSQEDMIKTHKLYYGDAVNIQTPAKIIRFKLLSERGDRGI